jgi:hypothetical protein
VSVGRQIHAGGMFLTLFIRRPVERRLGKSVIVTGLPLRLAFLAFDFGCVHKAVSLGPLGCSCMGLVISDILQRLLKDTPHRGR